MTTVAAASAGPAGSERTSPEVSSRASGGAWRGSDTLAHAPQGRRDPLRIGQGRDPAVGEPVDAAGEATGLVAWILNVAPVDADRRGAGESVGFSVGVGANLAQLQGAGIHAGERHLLAHEPHCPLPRRTPPPP